MSARSLNALVAVVQTRLDDVEAVEAFDRKLAAYGYAPLPDYDEPAFLISKVVTYRVKDEFPRLTRPHLPTGVTKVAYDIRLDALEPHECDGEAVFGEN